MVGGVSLSQRLLRFRTRRCVSHLVTCNRMTAATLFLTVRLLADSYENWLDERSSSANWTHTARQIRPFTVSHGCSYSEWM